MFVREHSVCAVCHTRILLIVKDVAEACRRMTTVTFEGEYIVSTTPAESGISSASPGPDSHNIRDWTDLGREMWSYLTGRAAAVNYSFIDMVVEVPRDIGPDAPRAIWKLNGTLRVTTSDDHTAGSDPHRN